MSPGSSGVPGGRRPLSAEERRKVFLRRRLAVGGSALVVVLALVAITNTMSAGASAAKAKPSKAAAHVTKAPKTATVHTPAVWTPQAWVASLERKVAGQPGHLQPGSNPSVLPGPVLIADRNNSRLLLVDPKGRILWQWPTTQPPVPGGPQFQEPDDAFFGPHGHHILATQESQFTISKISVRTGQLVWHYGHPGVPGSGPGYLDNPDDALLLPNGNVMMADIKNCRLLELQPGLAGPLHVYGTTDPYCYHAPPLRFGSPNGMFPMLNGNWLITEINGDWVDAMTPSGSILWSTHPPGITYPSDTNEVSPGVFLTASYTYPGTVEEFNQSGQLLWRYAPTGAAALNKPSLALPLPNGDVLVNDDWNHRVIVIDPKSNQIVWQYGVTGVAGSAPGYLDKPDGVDLAPPYSLLMTHASTMGIPPFGGG